MKQARLRGGKTSSAQSTQHRTPAPRHPRQPLGMRPPPSGGQQGGRPTPGPTQSPGAEAPSGLGDGFVTGRKVTDFLLIFSQLLIHMLPGGE